MERGGKGKLSPQRFLSGLVPGLYLRRYSRMVMCSAAFMCLSVCLFVCFSHDI